MVRKHYLNYSILWGLSKTAPRWGLNSQITDFVLPYNVSWIRGSVDLLVHVFSEI